jgi:hypothetical protein
VGEAGVKAANVAENPYAATLAAHASLDEPREYRSADMLVRLLSMVLVFLALGEGINGLVTLAEWRKFEDFDALLEADDPEALAVQGAYLALGAIMLPGNFAAMVLFYVWVYRAGVNARALGAVGMRFSPGWGVAWFFIPIARLWKPLQVMREIYRASDPSAAANGWTTAPVAALIGWWWAVWIVSMAMFRLTFVAGFVEVFQGTAGWVDQLEIAWIPVSIADNLLALAVVRSIHRRQEEKHALRAS